MERDDRTGPLLITATAPTPNGPLHVGHLSGPYLAADIASRVLEAEGREAVTVGGLDPNQNYVVTKAEAQGRSTDELLDDYCTRIRRAWGAARISYDVLVDPQHDGAYGEAVTGLVSALVSSGAAAMTEATLLVCPSCHRTMHHAYVSGDCPVCGKACSGGTCEGCASFVTASDLVTPRCARCGSEPEELPARVPVLRLEDYRSQLIETWARATIPPRIRALVDRYLAQGLPDVVLAYPTDWGIPWAVGAPNADSEDLRVDVWVEMGLGYVFAVARHLDAEAGASGSAEAYVAAWEQAGPLWHFLGIDNAFYFSVMFPALFVAAGIPVGSLGGIVVNEFFRLDGKKFSTSRNHAIWADEILAEEDPEWLRLYLCWDRPDRYESDFTRARFEAFRRHYQAVLSGLSKSGLPAELTAQESRRARAALDLADFDTALAVRCALGAATTDPRSVRAVLACLASGEVRAPEPAMS